MPCSYCWPSEATADALHTLFELEIHDYNDEPFSGWAVCKACGTRFGFSVEAQEPRRLWTWTLVPADRNSGRELELSALFDTARKRPESRWLEVTEDARADPTVFHVEVVRKPIPPASWEIAKS